MKKVKLSTGSVVRPTVIKIFQPRHCFKRYARFEVYNQICRPDNIKHCPVNHLEKTTSTVLWTL